jgi:hypothetical protein|eukprot:COSAG01_NODE_3411_length_6127_cov_5.921699_3_plen_76_part_00
MPAAILARLPTTYHAMCTQCEAECGVAHTQAMGKAELDKTIRKVGMSVGDAKKLRLEILGVSGAPPTHTSHLSTP